MMGALKLCIMRRRDEFNCHMQPRKSQYRFSQDAAIDISDSSTLPHVNPTPTPTPTLPQPLNALAFPNAVTPSPH